MVENDYQGAVTIFSKVIDLVPGYENAYIKRSLAYKALGLYQQSLADLSMVMELSGETGDLLKQRGDLYVLAGEDAHAVDDYTQAITFDPADVEADFNRSVAYARLSKTNEAIADLDQVISLVPTRASAYFNRAVLYENLNEYENALVDYSKAIQLSRRMRGKSTCAAGWYMPLGKNARSISRF